MLALADITNIQNFNTKLDVRAQNSVNCCNNMNNYKKTNIFSNDVWASFGGFWFTFSSRHFIFFWSTILKIIQYLPGHPQTERIGWYWYFVLSFCYGKECGNLVPLVTWVPIISEKNCFIVPSSVEPCSFLLPLLNCMNPPKLVPNFLNKTEEAHL